MINLYNGDSGYLIGTITDEQLAFLIDNMEEESSEDQDYYINEPTLDYLESRGMDAALLALLRAALGEDRGVTIRWGED